MSKDDNSVNDLLKIYNQVDAFLRKQPKSDRNAEHSYLIQLVAKTNNIVAKYESELRAVAQLRNSIVHNPMAENISPIAYPNPVVVNRYRTIYAAMLKPRLALSIAVPASNIYSSTLESSLNKVLKDMNDNIFTHVPIIEDSKMIGIFSENTLLNYLADNAEAIILDDMTIADFKDYLPLESHKSERFAFLPRNAKLSDVYDIFNRAIKVRQRIGMLFITEQGKVTEKPLGVITAWDLASSEFELQ